MKLVWSAFALSDRDGIFTHIEADNRNLIKSSRAGRSDSSNHSRGRSRKNRVLGQKLRQFIYSAKP